jgi:tRNA(adenine34) deaminase
VELTEGVLEEECSALLSDFFKELRKTKSQEKQRKQEKV